jgi:hypothetical protein
VGPTRSQECGSLGKVFDEVAQDEADYTIVMSTRIDFGIEKDKGDTIKQTYSVIWKGCPKSFIPSKSACKEGSAARLHSLRTRSAIPWLSKG